MDDVNVCVSLQSIDIQGEVNRIDVDLSDLEILTPEIQEQLTNIEQSTQIDYSTFSELVRGHIFEILLFF